MRESKIEKLLREGVEAAGGMCEKFVSPGKRGVPDRIVTWPGCFRSLLGERCATVHFVETKAGGKAPKPHQARDHRRRRDIDQMVFVIDSEEGVHWYLRNGAHMDLITYRSYTSHRHPFVVGNGQ